MRPLSDDARSGAAELLFFTAGQLPAAFIAAMDDDLNVPQALGVLHETVRAGNTALAAGDNDCRAGCPLQRALT